LPARLFGYFNVYTIQMKPYRGLYKKDNPNPWKISRSKIELFTQCKRCFWLEAIHGIKRPSSPPFNINKAIDELFKKEFDIHRAKGERHPLMVEFKVDALPFQHDQLDTWRENFIGVSTVHEPTNLHVFGAVDDVWVNPAGELIVVDYKATAKDQPVKALRPKGTWHDMYRRQMETYQWLLRQNGFKVSDTGYFVYATGTWDRDGFGDRVEFETHVFPHHGNSDWVEPTLLDIKKTLDGNIPEVGVAAMGGDCEHCMYAKSRTELTLNALRQK